MFNLFGSKVKNHDSILDDFDYTLHKQTAQIQKAQQKSNEIRKALKYAHPDGKISRSQVLMLIQSGLLVMDEIGKFTKTFTLPIRLFWSLDIETIKKIRANNESMKYNLITLHNQLVCKEGCDCGRSREEQDNIIQSIEKKSELIDKVLSFTLDINKQVEDFMDSVEHLGIEE